MAEDKKSVAPVAGATDKKTGTEGTEAASQTKVAPVDAKSTTVNDAEEVNPIALSKKMQDRVDAIFKAKPICEKLFVTADNSIFDDKGYANSHSKTLKDKTVQVIVKS